MIPPGFEYYAPTSVNEATALLKQHGAEAKILSGGMSVIPLMKLRLVAPRHIIDINRIPEMAYIKEADGFLKIGALTRESDLERSELIRSKYPILTDTASTIADPLVRNMATVAGNLAHGDPANDHPATMLALGAQVVALGPKGERRIPVSSFFTGIRSTAVNPDELLTEILIPIPPAGTSASSAARSSAFATGGSRGESKDSRQSQRNADGSGSGAEASSGPLHPRHFSVNRHPHRVRHESLWRMHGTARRKADQVLHVFCDSSGWTIDHDGGGPGAERNSSSRTGGLLPGARPAVRVLHSRHDADGRCFPERESQADLAEYSPSDFRQSLSLHRLRQHRKSDSVCRSKARGGRVNRGASNQP